MENYCNLCPRKCNVNRNDSVGFCGCGKNIKIARASLHHWEEPVISGTKGSGTVFFSGCQLKCIYCQNYKISHDCFGTEISSEKLANIFDNLASQGAENINLVSGTPYIPQIIQAIKARKTNLPIVWNSSGYESDEGLKLLDGYVDIYLPDLKYQSEEMGKLLSKAQNYFEVATSAIEEMFRQVGEPVINDNGIMKKGVIIRHLLLPEQYENTRNVIDYVAEKYNNKVLFSLMGQYTPFGKSESVDYLKDKIDNNFYKWAVNYCLSSGIESGFFQPPDASGKEYIPDFNLQGIL